MTTKIVMSIYFDADESNRSEVSALIAKLLGSSDSVSTTVENVEPVVEVTKVRKTRVMTDEQKAAFRARMIAGREAKESTKSKSDEPVKSSGSKKSTKAELAATVSTKPKSIDAPMPRTGHKVEASPAAQ